MNELAHLECPRCRGATAYRPEVLEQLFDAERVSRNHVSYLVACRYCRAPATLIVCQSPGQGPAPGRRDSR